MLASESGTGWEQEEKTAAACGNRRRYNSVRLPLQKACSRRERMKGLIATELFCRIPTSCEITEMPLNDKKQEAYTKPIGNLDASLQPFVTSSAPISRQRAMPCGRIGSKRAEIA